jgi:hypothetical protein
MTPRRRTLDVLALSLLVAASFVALPARAAVFVYSCVLSPIQESPVNTGTRAIGAGRFVIDTDANTVTYRIVFSRLIGTEVAAHIHGSATSVPGMNAGVLVTLPAGNPKVGVWNFTEAQQPLILNGLCYANIHSSVFPNGEIRGQIVPLNAVVDGAQETPPVATHGRGFATFTVDTVANVLSYYVRYDSLNSAEILAHIHGNALHGVPAAVKFAFPTSGSPKVGTWNYAQADEDALLSGRMYVNVHTTTSPGGEIRGQICPVVVPMAADEEVALVTPAPGSSGFALVAIDTTAVGGHQLSFDLHVDSLSATATLSHIHGFSPPGEESFVLFSIAPTPRQFGTWAYGAANEANVLAGLTYFNAHTTVNGGGEIRGQIFDLPHARSPLSVGDGVRATSGLAAAPNPFGTRTVLSFQLARTGRVSLAIVGVDGRIVRHVPPALFAPGPHSYEWDGRDDDGHAAAPGVYFAVVRTPDGEKVTRVARIR